MNILIVYERKNREFENSVLLKVLLENLGHKCNIAQYYEAEKFNFWGKIHYDIIFVPSLYNSDAVKRTVARFGKPNRIINMQYEQVLSGKWEKFGHHNPKGLAKGYEHICWGNRTLERLSHAGVPKDNLHVTGAIQLDLLNERFLEPQNTRSTLSEQHGLPNDRKWKLFLSSFTYADITDARLKMNENIAGTKLSSFKDIHTKSRNSLISWFEEVLNYDLDSVFIYRPHPDEQNLEPIMKLAEKYDNFVILNENSAKVWIEASDTIFSWYSTTVAECHYMNKPYAILRPHQLPDDFDVVMLKSGNFIQSKNAFVEFYMGQQNQKALTDEALLYYYANGSSRLAVDKIIDVLHTSPRPDAKVISFTRASLLSHIVKSLVVVFVNKTLVHKSSLLEKWLTKLSFFANWKKEIEGESVSEKEKTRIFDSVVTKLRRGGKLEI